MRRLPLLLAAGALWLFLAAIPALADGGPHVMNQNNGSLGINADGCAGCHRIHTAQGPLLLKAGTDETGLCLSCHGAAVTGATTDVMTGMQYQLASGARSGTQLGALRGGGFDQARIGDPIRLVYWGSRGASDTGRVAPGAAEDVTSSHLDLDGAGGVVAKNIAWGNGENGTGVGPTVSLTCVACHNPHGNGQYRILRPVPELDNTAEIIEIPFDIIAADASDDRVYLASTAPLLPGDKVVVAGNSGTGVNGTWLVDNSITNGNGGTWIKLRDVTTNALVDITVSGTGGTLTRSAGMTVTDAALPGAGDARNYTVIQRTSSALLYASQVLAGGNRTDVIEIVSSNATTEEITTAAPHGLTANDPVVISYHNAVATPSIAGVTVTNPNSYTPFTGKVLLVTGPDTFTLQTTGNVAVDITTAGGNFGWVTRTYAVGSYAASDGDYFHRYGNWLTAADYDSPVGTTGANTNSTDSTSKALFDDQITQWCTSCHTRYYAWQNKEAQASVASADGATEVVTTAAAHGLTAGADVAIAGQDAIVDFTVPVSSATASNDRITTARTHNVVVGDTVQITGVTGAVPSLASYSCTVATVPSATTFTCTGLDITTNATANTGTATVTTSLNGTWRIDTVPSTTTFTLLGVNITTSGTAVGQVLEWGPSYDVEREGDATYKFQHRTRDNRACTTCHVSHGSNAQMTGTFSSTVNYPNGDVSASSRLLKVDNRGTCQLCHDPTGTQQVGWVTGVGTTTSSRATSQ